LLLTVTTFAVLLQHSSALSPRVRPAQPQPAARFGFESVQRIAQQRAAEAYHDHSGKLPDSLSKISYEDYRNIQFRSDQALWRNQALFEVQFFHRGFAYDRRVNVTEVGDDGMLRSVNYEPSQFEFGKGAPPKDLPADLGCACTSRCSAPTIRTS
jgi:glucans biosynthesis protein